MRETSPRNLLLRGHPGVGKTTVLQKLMATLPRVRFGGFFGRRDDRRRSLRQLVLVEGKNREPTDLPLERPAPLPGFTVFDTTSLTRKGLPCLERALAEAQVAVIDEIGPEEAGHAAFVELVSRAFEAPLPVLAAGQDPAPPFLEELAERPDTLVLQVRPDNRTRLPELLADELMAILERT